MPIRETAWPTGTPAWIDLSTSDPEAARTFYSELFGWDLEVGPSESGHYATAFLRNRRVAGINGMPMTDHPPVWATYLATDDAVATQAKVEQSGGKVVMPAMDVMGLGVMALVEAAGGGFFGLWQAGTHTGFGVFNETGAVVWNEFMARDYAAAQAFFADVAGFTYTEIGAASDAGGFQYSTAELGGQTVGGIGAMPVEVPAQVPPHWRVYFAVDDCDAAVEQVEKLGGTTLRPPADMPYGRHADVADPQGAMFSVIKPGSPS